MNTEKHTPEPWLLMDALHPGGGRTIQISNSVSHNNEAAIVHWTGFDSGDRSISEKRANARRIVACVNACVGASTEWLEGNRTIVLLGPPVAERFQALEQQRDELAEALRNLRKMCDPNMSHQEDLMVRTIDAALAKLCGSVAHFMLHDFNEPR